MEFVGNNLARRRCPFDAENLLHIITPRDLHDLARAAHKYLISEFPKAHDSRATGE